MKANVERKKIILFFSIICLYLFNGCGIEEYIYIEYPRNVYNPPSYSTTDNVERVFSFDTYEKDQPNEFLGTAIYYKIYNKHSRMDSQVSSITSLITSTNESASAIKMIDTLGYKQLCLNTGFESPLISKSEEKKSKKIYIRLSNYYDNEAIVQIDGVNIGKPRRNFGGNKYTFDFGRGQNSSSENYDEYSVIPNKDDDDVDFVDSEDEDISNAEYEWYVDLFAVGVGEDENFTQYYSKVLHLGSVAIDVSSEHN